MDPKSADSSSEPPATAPGVEVPVKAEVVAESPVIEPHTEVSDNELRAEAPDGEHPADVSDTVPVPPGRSSLPNESPSGLYPSSVSSWAKRFISQPSAPAQQDSQAGTAGMSTFARFTSGLGLRSPSVAPALDKSTEGTSVTSQAGVVLESFTKGLVDSSWGAVKAMQVKARHIVSQNKRRYQEGGFDLDMTYITENIIAMGFPAGDISSGIFGYFEGFYRNHMEEVIKFFETHHKGKYKVYNLCSERLYDASLFEGKVASFPFDDHNCPPIQLISSFCQSAYSWLKEDIQNVVVVHCKAGMARTGLMICSLLLYLKFFPTAEEAMEYYNQKRCVDGKALVLPSQIRYVKYFERVLTHFKGESPPGRRCMLRGFRLLKCPYWIRPSITISNHTGILFTTKKHPKTKNLMPEDFWISSPKKGIVVFALPGEPGLAELVGDFKIHFHDRHGDFYCWLNTTMMENRKTLDATDLDGFDKRKLPSPGFQVEVVMIDYDGTLPPKLKAGTANKGSDGSSVSSTAPSSRVAADSNHAKASVAEDNDDVFSDSDGEDNGASNRRQTRAASRMESAAHASDNRAQTLVHGTEKLSIKSEETRANNASKDPVTKGTGTGTGTGKAASGIGISNSDSIGASDFKAIAADASVFSFGDDEDFESE